MAPEHQPTTGCDGSAPTRDRFGARYYDSQLGRFLSPDWSPTPEAIPYADLENPHSLNLYAYVGNDPATATDPNGHFFDGGNCGYPCEVNSTAEWIQPPTFVKIALRLADFLRDAGHAGVQAHTATNAFVEQHPYLTDAAVFASAALDEGGEGLGSRL